jgi:hypothetical protein
MNPTFGPSLSKEMILAIVINEAIEVVNPPFLAFTGIKRGLLSIGGP